MRLGTKEWNVPLLLAPMAGFTDMSFRTLCIEHGADAAVTEMISAKGLTFDNRRTKEYLATSARERPVIVQLFGSEPEVLGRAVDYVLDTLPDAVLAIDLNMGCPARKVTGNFEGSALMREPALAEKIVAATVRAAGPVPVTVKMRSGYDAQHINAPEIAKLCEQAGAAAVAVHGRTREQMYGGRADRNVIAAVKKSVRIPVIGNGDVADGESARAMLAETGCDGLMIGRAALGNPWVFEEIRAALTGAAYAPPTARERAETALRHAEMTVSHKGERGMLELRKHLAFYLRGTKGAARQRTALQTCKTLDEMAKILLDTREQR